MSRRPINPVVNYSRQCSENVLALIAEIKARKHLTDAALAKTINMNPNTFTARKQDPGTFRMFEVWAMLQILNVPDEKKKSIVVIEEGGQAV